ncbi:hypothetical protein RHOFW510R12_03805 [Rhodanobacter sp. FW510-R12]|uniref:hypothetical protein n=1 Tax=unclassified Rhodanobacter TaxID=2621553 RepID=UPI0007AA2313|nr:MULTISPECIES: hypothetical protein [unclassified Rhodanobacter]KZC15832.1 hypothetical protein RHOFW104R8_02760 [Rhodanobacter sp. FW104-R8]KZC26148.1 hypothetical protein RhoFW510T8_03970 [Rhodanobacter sp. FW510-T8]KZC29945.1 hypothetical protein RhoFW510R10_03805 [Rhodanobacter sp. FW510-R10]
MSDVIGFLDQVGQDARLGRGTGGEFELALTSAGFDPQIQDAIRTGSQARLEALLGMAPAVGFLAPGEEQEDDAEEAPSRDDEEEAPELGTR